MLESLRSAELQKYPFGERTFMENLYFAVGKNMKAKNLDDIINRTFDVTDNEFKLNEFSLNISSSSQRKNNATIRKYLLTISCNKSASRKTAEILYLAENQLRDQLKIDYFLIPLQLDSSLYFAKKMYEHFTDIELKLRQIIIRILIGQDGPKWLDKQPDRKKEFADKMLCNINDPKIYESSIHEYTFGELNKLLFDEKPKKHFLEDIANQSLSINLEYKSSEEISKIFEDYLPISIWNQAISKIDKDNQFISKTTLNSLRINRNQFAHYKEILPAEYDKFMEDRKLLLYDLGRIIDTLNLGSTHSEVFAAFSELSKPLNEMREQYFEASYSISEAFESEALISIKNQFAAVKKNIDLLKLSEVLTSIKNTIDSVKIPDPSVQSEVLTSIKDAIDSLSNLQRPV